MSDNQSPVGGQNNQNQIQVKMPDEVLKGSYANMLQISNSAEEFILDFMNLFPPSGIVTSRVIVSPGHMKRIVGVLQNVMEAYEKQYGKVTAQEEPKGQIGFRTEN